MLGLWYSGNRSHAQSAQIRGSVPRFFVSFTAAYVRGPRSLSTLLLASIPNANFLQAITSKSRSTP
jgi:uncharacterized membrane protein